VVEEESCELKRNSILRQDNVIAGVAAAGVHTFFQPEQSDERQPTRFTLEISPTLLLPLREFLRVGVGIDRRLRRFPGT